MIHGNLYDLAKLCERRPKTKAEGLLGSSLKVALEEIADWRDRHQSELPFRDVDLRRLDREAGE